MNSTYTYATREQWLLAAIQEFRHWFTVHGYNIPDALYVSCGFPKGKAGKAHAIGQCWPGQASADGAPHLFISPTLIDPLDRQGGILEVLCHELIHATIGCQHGHKAPFKRAMKAIGLEGRATSTTASERLLPFFHDISVLLGPYPHAKLTDQEKGKKQSTRLVKVECIHCSDEKGPYCARITRKWLEQLGAPICPGCSNQMQEAS